MKDGMRTARLVATVALALGAGATLGAHDMWIDPTTFATCSIG